MGDLSLEDACSYYINNLHAFQIDMPMAAACFNRLLAEDQATRTPQANALLEQSIKSAMRLASLDPDILRLGAMSGLAPRAEVVAKVLEATHVEPEAFNQLRQAPLKHHAEEVRSICRSVLRRHPRAVRFADMLLGVDLFQGRAPDEALDAFNCPNVLRPLWAKRLFDHYAALGDDNGAWPLWERIRESARDPLSCSRAAEMHRRAGRLDQAVALYEQALELDPLQYPYAARIEALRNPFVPDHGLPDRSRVCIYLYSCNKAAVLGETLESLAACRIGPARIKVLLNGCTDDSLQTVQNARGLFPDNEFEIISLPVNIGAPAARNWLLSQPATGESDYVAFLDDDVFLQPDWLAHMLTVAESDPAIGNVGCKVVFPGERRLLQYLYRYVAYCTDETVRISLPTPYAQYDIGLYDVIRETRVVMGCQHLLRVASLRDAPWYDIRYSPSQIDDTDHDLQLCLGGWKVMFCGTVACVHRQNSGTSVRSRLDLASQGNIRGNDLKFAFKWLAHRDRLRLLDSISCPPFRG